MIVKIPFQNKSYKLKNGSAAIVGNLFIKCKIKNKKIVIEGGQMMLHEGTEFNEHQQKTFDTSDGLRNKFAENFSINAQNPSKKLYLMNNEQLNWWNQKLKSKQFGSLLNISKWLTGNNPSGSQQKKKSAEFILKNGHNQNKPFFNLLRVFANKNKLNALDFDYSVCKSYDYDEFLKKASKISEKYRFIIFNNFYNEKEEKKYFYIDEVNDYLGIEIKNNKKESKLRAEFRQNLISTYKRLDQLYKTFKSKKMVEAAHIKPVKHSINVNNYDEIKDLNNGLLLSPDIHKLFDSGLITFNSANGKVIYTTNSKNSFEITCEEVKLLQLDSYSLDKELLTKERIKYLNYHNKEVYQHGV